MKKTIKILLFSTAVLSFIVFGFTTYFIIATKNYRLDSSKLISNQNKIEYYSFDGSLILSETSGGSVDYIQLDKLSENTKNAFIAIEDKRFYSHNGIDAKRIVGASISNLKAMSFKEGASTISQQLIKNTHLSNEKTIKRKFAELKITRQLEKAYSKDAILEKYLNTIYFGKGAYGINSASKVYFNKTADELTLGEACTLAGVIKSPLKYSPSNNYENSQKRKNLVLSAMKSNSFISSDEYNKAVKENVVVYTGKANGCYDSYIKAVKNEFESSFNYSPYGVNTIKIHTYLDKNLQEKIANTSVEDCENLNKNIIVINSKNNGVIAFYGINSNLKRCPASCVKPWLVYAPMINEKYISESTVITDEKTNFNGYSPKNVGNKYYGKITVKDAVKKSLNVPAVKLVESYGIDKLNKYTNQFNVNVNNLSCALGSIDGGMTLKELSDCYSPFSSLGNYNQSNFINYVSFENGKKVYSKQNTKEVFSKQTCYIINDMLKDAVKDGTSKKLKDLNYDVCAKTGTNGNENGNIDAYSICYTTENIVGVWLGNADGSLMQNKISGGSYPTIYAKEVLKELYKDNSPKNFEYPNGIVEAYVDENELLSNQKTYVTDKEIGRRFLYINGTQPTKRLPVNKPLMFENCNASIKNGIVTINLECKNAVNLVVLRQNERKCIEIYNGEPINAIKDKLINFGKYTYTIIIKNELNEKLKTTLPQIKYDISSLDINNQDWWED